MPCRKGSAVQAEVHVSELKKPLALIGMMGSGKTTVGRTLAALLGVAFLDSDAVIEERTGKTVAEIFKTDGESAFRDWEADVVAEALAVRPAAVIGVAGGAVLRDETRSALQKEATVVWLRAPIETLIRRVSARKLDRPLIAEDPEAAMKELYDKRFPVYEQTAEFVVDVSQKTPQEIANEVIAVIA
jgi:shikimate kinase